MKINEIHFEEIDSTNSYLKREYLSLENFTFVLASFQNKGKGREDRIWQSNKDENLLFSLLIKDIKIMEKFESLSIGVATVVAKQLESLGVHNVSIKWPNDVYVNGKKIAGILLEACLPNYLIIGVGINVNQTTFPNDLRRPATSLKLEGINIELDELKNTLYNSLYIFINNIDSHLDNINAYLDNHNFLKNKKIKVGNIIGIVKEIDDKNRLIIINDKIYQINSGEVEIFD